MSQSDTPTTVPLDGTVRPAAEARCIAARNKLNAVLHGEGAVIDDLESAVANAVAEIERLRVAMTDWRAAVEAAQQLLALAEKLQERAVAAERERLLGGLRALLNDKPNATALTALAALTPSAPLSQADIEWADRFARGEA